MIIVNEIFRLKKIIRRYYRERKQTLIGEPAAELREMPASDIGRVLRKEMRRFRVPGMAAAIFSRQRVVWSLAIGYADLLRGRPMSVDTVFRVASISKMVAAVAIMQLYEQERLDLEQDISQLLGFEVVNPFYPGRPITVSHLLTHTSTIVDNRTYLEMAENDPQAFNHTDIRDFLSPDGRYYSRDNFARFCPGEEFVYSNLAIGVLGSIVECLSGMRYDSYCQEHIFAPLGMDAGFEPAAIRNWHNYAVLYRVPLFRKRGYLIGSDQGMDRPVRRTITTRVGSALGCNPAGGLRVNVVDLAKFMIMLSNGGVFGNRRLLGQISSEIMRCVAWQGNGMNGLYKYKSLGFHITEDLVPEVRLIGHSAEAYGMIGDAYFRPDDGWGMIFFLNGGVTRDAVDSGFYEVEMAMADRLYAHMQKLKLEENKSND